MGNQKIKNKKHCQIISIDAKLNLIMTYKLIHKQICTNISLNVNSYSSVYFITYYNKVLYLTIECEELNRVRRHTSLCKILPT